MTETHSEISYFIFCEVNMFYLENSFQKCSYNFKPVYAKAVNLLMPIVLLVEHTLGHLFLIADEN